MEEDKIVREFNGIVGELINSIKLKLRAKEHQNVIDTAQRRLSLLKSASLEGPVLESARFFVPLTEIISNRTEYEKKILAANFRQEYARLINSTISDADELLLNLMECIRSIYSNLTKEERDTIYGDVKKLNELCLEYQIAITPDDT